MNTWQPWYGSLSVSSNLNVADLALTALSFMGKRGPSSLLLPEVRQHFKEHPEQLCQLAHYSLQCGTLITPVVVPLSKDNFQRYSSAIERWMKLRDSYQVTRITGQDIATCLAIHEDLLNCAEEVAYPTSIHLVEMLQRATAAPSQWQHIWQAYLLVQLNAGHYISYQDVALLWVMLFTEQQEQKLLADCILQHYVGSPVPARFYAQRFIATLSEDLRGLRDLGYLRYLRYLRELLLTQDVAERAKLTLAAADVTHCKVLLAILMGRVLHVEEAEEMNSAVEHEVQQIVDTVHNVLAAGPGDEVKAAGLDVLRYLPVRRANEVKYVRQLVESAAESDVQGACISYI